MNEKREMQVREHFVEKSLQTYDSLADKVQEMKEFYTSLQSDDKCILERVIVAEVLQKEGTRQYGILLSGSLHLETSEQYLFDWLEIDEQNRGILIVALGDLKSERSYELIQSYLATHKHQAVQALAMIDYERTTPVLRTIINCLPNKEAHQLLSCVFLQRREECGGSRVIQDVEQLKTGNEKIDREVINIVTEATKV